MKLTFIGADHEVTGSCHYVEAGSTKFLVDCGIDVYKRQPFSSRRRTRENG